jgi:hypothetical protein
MGILMCWLGFVYGLLVMGLIGGIGWCLEWLEQQGRKGHAIREDEPLLSEIELLRIAKEYEGHKDVELMIREIRRCRQ